MVEQVVEQDWNGSHPAPAAVKKEHCVRVCVCVLCIHFGHLLTHDVIRELVGSGN